MLVVPTSQLLQAPLGPSLYWMSYHFTPELSSSPAHFTVTVGEFAFALITVDVGDSVSSGNDPFRGAGMVRVIPFTFVSSQYPFHGCNAAPLDTDTSASAAPPGATESFQR